MSQTFEVYAHIWREADTWYCGIIDMSRMKQPPAEPSNPFGYTALSLLDPNMLIHCYWLGGMPSDAERDDCQGLIVQQAMGYYNARA